MEHWFKCGMCKRLFDVAEIALDNGTGKYCAGCKLEIGRRHKAAITKRQQKPRLCIWCGDDVDGGESPPDDVRENCRTCKSCSKHRAWLLKCMRISAHPAEYVARRENREAAKRQKRLALQVGIQKIGAVDFADSGSEFDPLTADDLLRNATGRIVEVEHNVAIILNRHPDWRGVLAFDDVSSRVEFIADPPWAGRRQRYWTNESSEALGVWMAEAVPGWECQPQHFYTQGAALSVDPRWIERDRRERAARALHSRLHQAPESPPAAPALESQGGSRIDRIEQKLERLIESLGGI